MTVDEAKEKYYEYDCSWFRVAREEMALYQEIQKMGIPQPLIDEWSLERIRQLCEEVLRTGSVKTFLKMYKICDGLRNINYLDILEQAYSSIKVDDNFDRIRIAEVLIGRKENYVRSGLIFMSYDLGKREITKRFLKDVRNFLQDSAQDSELSKRAERNMDKFNEICTMLGEL